MFPATQAGKQPPGHQPKTSCWRQPLHGTALLSPAPHCVACYACQPAHQLPLLAHPVATDAKVSVTQLHSLLRCDHGLTAVAVVNLHMGAAHSQQDAGMNQVMSSATTPVAVCCLLATTDADIMRGRQAAGWTCLVVNQVKKLTPCGGFVAITAVL